MNGDDVASGPGHGFPDQQATEEVRGDTFLRGASALLVRDLLEARGPGSQRN